MMAYCGIDCSACRAYRATIAGDEAGLEEAAERFGGGRYPAEDWVCLGCRPADQPFLARYCAACGIRSCAIARGLGSCAGCSDFEECARLQSFLRGEAEALGRTMNLLRRRFLSRGREAAGVDGAPA